MGKGAILRIIGVSSARSGISGIFWLLTHSLIVFPIMLPINLLCLIHTDLSDHQNSKKGRSAARPLIGLWAMDHWWPWWL
jgi:hypothetical protein